MLRNIPWLLCSRAGAPGSGQQGPWEKGRPSFLWGSSDLLLPLDTIVPLCKAFTLMWKPRKRAQLYCPRGICTFSGSHLSISSPPFSGLNQTSPRTQLKCLLLQEDFPDSPTSKSLDSSCGPQCSPLSTDHTGGPNGPSRTPTAQWVGSPLECVHSPLGCDLLFRAPPVPSSGPSMQ